MCAHVGWCIVVAAALAQIASLLHCSRKSGVSRGKNEWKLNGICCILGIICGLSWTGVFFFFLLQREVCAVQKVRHGEWNK